MPAQNDKARIEGLRAAAKEGFDAAQRGDVVKLRSEQDLDSFPDQIYQDAVEELAGHRKGGQKQRTAAAHAEEGFQQAERGELTDGDQALVEIRASKEEWRLGRQAAGVTRPVRPILKS